MARISHSSGYPVQRSSERPEIRSLFRSDSQRSFSKPDGGDDDDQSGGLSPIRMLDNRTLRSSFMLEATPSSLFETPAEDETEDDLFDSLGAAEPVQDTSLDNAKNEIRAKQVKISSSAGEPLEESLVFSEEGESSLVPVHRYYPAEIISGSNKNKKRLKEAKTNFKLGEKRRKLLKSAISEKLRDSQLLKLRCSEIGKVKTATLPELFEMSRICGLDSLAMELNASRDVERRLQGRQK